MQPVRMAAVNLTLKLCLLISFGFTDVFIESSEDHTSAEPNPNLECINDFLSEMMCRLTPDQWDSCSEYSLIASRDTDYKQFECHFKLDYSSCGCTFHVNSGFVLNENFKIDVMRKKKLLLTKNINTTSTIKPVKPVIMSVNQTQSGNFVIVLDTKYNNEPGIDENLIPQLIYYVEGRNKRIKYVNLTKSQRSPELIGRELESMSEYIVKARVKYDLSPSFSDYSDSYTFKTPMSLRDILKIVTPIICVTLICVIITVYFSYTTLLADWWQKIPTPKIATSFVKQVPNLLSFQNEFSPIHLESSKLVHAVEKICPESSLADFRGENSLNSLGKNSNSAEVIYGQTGNESILSPSRNCDQILMSNKYYKNLKTYMLSFSDKFHNSDPRNGISDFNENGSVVTALTANLAPVIQVDFEYGPCTGCSGSENASPNQSTPSSNDITVVPGYQSVNELDCTPTVQPFISSHNDVDLIMDKLICSKNSQKIAPESIILPVENGYKDFQSLLRNSAEQQILNTEPELKHMCGPPLHTVPGIQIDCSYHKV